MAEQLKATVTIVNRLGLHARPAMSFVDTAAAYHSSVRVRKDDTDVDGKSIMEMMMLAATKGTKLEVAVEGEDAEACLAELIKLVGRGFDEE
ncbi:MAG: HPr family phosphocarrier protein [Planctomycetota bacterium]